MKKHFEFLKKKVFFHFLLLSLSLSSLTCLNQFLATDKDHLSVSQIKTTTLQPVPVQPSEILPDGRQKPCSQAKEVLNWQTKNARSQNRILKTIDSKLDKALEKTAQTDKRINEILHSESST
ncbi:hypothetical protein ACOSQ4_009567 [Xanthoceras sorbifolium]